MRIDILSIFYITLLFVFLGVLGLDGWARFWVGLGVIALAGAVGTLWGYYVEED